MTTALVRPVSSITWELRIAWATGRRVALSLDADEQRVEGWVAAVSPTGAFVLVGALHVPLDRVFAVHYPSRLGDSTIAAAEPWQGRRRRYVPQREALWEAA